MNPLLKTCALFPTLAVLAFTSAAEQRLKLVAAHVAQPPTLDGNADDAAWQQFKPLDLVTRGVFPLNEDATTRVTIRSVHTDADIFFLVTWEDAAADVSHKSWVWEAEKNAYEEGKDREDMLALAFEHTGPFTGDMLSGDEAIWDVWHWKAFRTNPQGGSGGIKLYQFQRCKVVQVVGASGSWRGPGKRVRRRVRGGVQLLGGHCPRRDSSWVKRSRSKAA